MTLPNPNLESGNLAPEPCQAALESSTATCELPSSSRRMAATTIELLIAHINLLERRHTAAVDYATELLVEQTVQDRRIAALIRRVNAAHMEK